jgi:hypothetical protein
MIGIAHGKEIDFVQAQKTVIGVAVDVHTHAHHGDAFGAQALLELDQRRHFLDAGRTPGGPEVQHQNLALEVVKCDFAIRVLHGEIGSRGPDVGRPGATVTTGEQERDGKKDEDASHKAIITNSADDGV